jgi:alkylation response protein AidB-like acyl-CoA dehydrogenase
VTENDATSLVRKVEPVIRQYRAQAEAERRLAPETMQAIVAAGIMQAWVPRAYGGLEMDPITAMDMFEEISRIDGAAGWVVSQCSILAYLGCLFPAEANQEMHAAPNQIFAGAWNPPGRAEPVPGGYRVSGRWPFTSGANYATWMSGLANVTSSEPATAETQETPQTIVVYFRATEAKILDTWRTLGMRGTGSNDVVIEDVFVPERRAWKIAPLNPPDPAFAGPLYRLGVWINAQTQSCVGLGIARAAIDDLMDLATKKTPSYQQTELADRSLVHDRVARARALIDAARSYNRLALQNAWDYVGDAEKIDIDHGTALALAACFAHEAACQAVDLVHACAGTSAIRDEHRFQQYFRDVHTLSQHAFTGPARYESLGKVMLGKESDWGFYYL